MSFVVLSVFCFLFRHTFACLACRVSLRIKDGQIGGKHAELLRKHGVDFKIVRGPSEEDIENEQQRPKREWLRSAQISTLS